MAKIVARFSTPGGRPYRGKVLFSPAADVVLGAVGDRVTILVGDFEAALDASGFFAIDIPPGVYTVRFKIDNAETGLTAKIRDTQVTVVGDSTLAGLLAPSKPVPVGSDRSSRDGMAHGVVA